MSTSRPDFLIFGQSGQLARTLAAQARSDRLSFFCAGRDVADLSKSGAARALIEKYQPRFVINAAAFTAVDLAEDESDLCKAINALAPGEMAEACADLGARFVHVSSDYVFSGEAHEPYTEDARPDPINFYGQSKLEGELRALDAYDQTAIVRTSAVFSGLADDFPSKILKLACDRDAIKIIDDQTTGPTPASELAKQLLALSQSQPSTGIFHCAGQPYVSWARFAEAFLDQANLLSRTRIVRVSSQEYPTRARRPKRSCLSGGRLKQATGLDAPQWQNSLSMMLDAWRT